MTQMHEYVEKTTSIDVRFDDYEMSNHHLFIEKANTIYFNNKVLSDQLSSDY